MHKKWEYLTAIVAGDGKILSYNLDMKQLGLAGWELIGVSISWDKEYPSGLAFFKRPLAEPMMERGKDDV